MSYKELSMLVLFDKNKKHPDDYPSHNPYTEEEKGAIDQLFGFPHFGAFLNTKNPLSVKGGKFHKNTVI